MTVKVFKSASVNGSVVAVVMLQVVWSCLQRKTLLSQQSICFYRKPLSLSMEDAHVAVQSRS